MTWSRHEPWIFLSIALVVSLAVLSPHLKSTGNTLLPPPNTLAHAPHVIDHRDAWKPALAGDSAPEVEGELVYVRNGYYVFEDDSYVADRNGNPLSVQSNSITGNAVYRSSDNPPQLLHVRYAPVVETCQDTDHTRINALDEKPTGQNSYFQPGMVMVDVRKQLMLGDTILSEEPIPSVTLKDRCYSAQELGYTNLPDYRGLVLEASCAALRGLKNAYIQQATERTVVEDSQLDGDLSWLSRYYTAQFCQKSAPLITSGSTQNIIQYVACGRAGEQGYCQ
ncbi:MAG TPA: hypothetical protein VJG90_00610 [Candidatus Nanoarchaeia archaeon]|nr:hypothetical protein [Candidatus Nanoarchaeia archaeon]